MASEGPEYFLPRNWDYLPGGPIKLGNVITSLKEPHRPLATIKPDPAKIVNSPKELVEIETERARSGGFSVLTTFLSGLLGLGVDTSVDVDKSASRYFTFDRLDTDYLDTTDENSEHVEITEYNKYIDRCVNAPTVKRYLERKRFRKQVYVITGIKRVSGAKCATKSSLAVDGLLGAQVDGTILTGGTVPVGGGPEVRGGYAKKFNISWKGSKEFVLAFKVSKIYVDKLGLVTKEEEYLKGAFLEHGAPKQDSSELDFRVVQPDVEAGFEVATVMEGDDAIKFGIPEDDEESDEEDEES